MTASRSTEISSSGCADLEAQRAEAAKVATQATNELEEAHTLIGVRTQWTHAHKEEQRHQTGLQGFNRVRRVLTRQVMLERRRKLTFHKHLKEFSSGQLPDLG